MKKNYKLTICYDGSRYYGWEHQPDRDTIQGKLENVLTKMCGEFIDVLGAGRTDAGVHARGMVANAVFDAADKERGGRERTPDEIREYMNSPHIFVNTFSNFPCIVSLSGWCSHP